MNDQAGLLPGTLDLLILKAVSLGRLHGYGVLLRIEQISGGALQIQQGALYPALYRLEHQGLIASEWGTSDKTASPNSAASSQRSRSSRPLEYQAPSVVGAPVSCAFATTSSMISLPTNSVATGSSARTSRSTSVHDASAGLVCQSSRRNGGRLRSAPKRSRSDRGCGGAGGGGGGIGPA